MQKKDERLKANIEEILNDNMQNSALGINIQIEKGYVKLYGMVDTLSEKEFAADLVKKLPDIKGLDNGLTVVMDNFRNDDELDRLVMEKFMDEPQIDVKKIGAECEKGVVILRGQASSLGEVELAKELAAQVPGVREVKSLVKFTEETRELDDSSIVNAVEVAFSASNIVEAEDVYTSCQKGIVTLEGMVDNQEQKEAAELFAKTVPGVRKVINELLFRHDNDKGDAYLTNELRRKLNREDRINPAHVKAYVEKGTAHISGKVFSNEAKKAAEELAGKMKGIKQVVNDITVAYH
ncbi:MAG: BON domain-containing protein [Peptococcaceae bacterium]